MVVVDFSDGQRWPARMRTWQVGGAPGELTLLGEYAPLPAMPAAD
jgi:hypothetical protein